MARFFAFLILLLPVSLAWAGECVVLLHGLARTATSMNKMQRELETAGYATANIDYPSREYRVQELAPMAVEAGISQCRDSGSDGPEPAPHVQPRHRARAMAGDDRHLPGAQSAAGASAERRGRVSPSSILFMTHTLLNVVNDVMEEQLGGDEKHPGGDSDPPGARGTFPL